jgi:molybdenum cofactor cytidylyltransferase
LTLTLSRAIRLESPITVAFAGSGGKTTAIFQIARELLEGKNKSGDNRPVIIEPVIVTTTTHFGISQISLADKHLIADTEQGFNEQLLNEPGLLLITGPIEVDKTGGLNAGQINRLHQFCREHNLFLLIEADGSRQRPIKAPAKHEPAIPDISEMVVFITGLTGFDQPLNKTVVHRPEIFSDLAGIHLEDRITIESLIRVLTHPEGGIKNIPPNSRRAIILNQADIPLLAAAAQKMVEPLLREFASVVIAALHPEPKNVPNNIPYDINHLPQIHSVGERIAGIILAAGGSERFGRPKQLLLWRGQPFIRAVVQTAFSARLDPVVVVVGAEAKLVTRAIDDLPVTIILNEEWPRGQSSSIQAGLLALEGTPAISTRTGIIMPATKFVGGAVFLLADQPQIPASVITALLELHSRELAPITAPLVLDERRANPVLFDRDTFPDMKSLDGDVGGRILFSKYPVTYLPWHDKNLLLDVDNPEDYEKLVSHDNSSS